jgi:hypothetical protein
MSIPLETTSKLFKNIAPKASQEIQEMMDVSYKELVGSLMYAMVAIRPNLFNVVIIVSQFMLGLSKEHWVVTKKIL